VETPATPSAHQEKADMNTVGQTPPFMDRPPLPPFTAETAARKARLAEDAWNSRDPARVALAYTADSRWRNRSEFFQGRDAIEEFLTRKWQREVRYRLIKEVWAFAANRIAVRFVYECRNEHDAWTRAHGNEQWGEQEDLAGSVGQAPLVQGRPKASYTKLHSHWNRRPWWLTACQQPVAGVTSAVARHRRGALIRRWFDPEGHVPTTA
jgi:hypothetical protein